MKVPVGSKNAVLPELLIKNHSIKCLLFEKRMKKPYNDLLCLSRPLTLHLNGNNKSEGETSKMFAAHPHNVEDVDEAKFQNVCMNDITTVEDKTETKISLQDFDIVDGALVGEFALRSKAKYSSTVGLLR